jgi:acyl-CoA synthetase (NDP forming)
MSLATAERDLSTMVHHCPRAIALVGATDRSTWSKAAFTNLTTRKYAGMLHLVARRGGIVHGRSAATSCVAFGEQIEIGLLMVPASGTEEALADLGVVGARNTVILAPVQIAGR